MKKLFVALSLLLAVGLSSAQEVTVWSHFGETDLEWLQGEAATFEAAFGVPVTITRIDLGELKQKMLLAAPQGEAADLVVTASPRPARRTCSGRRLSGHVAVCNRRLPGRPQRAGALGVYL